MATFTGGDITGITCNHPTLGSFNFSSKSNESYTLDPGGFRANDDANSITPDGKSINQINRVRWFFEGVIMADFQTNQEVENIPLLSQSSDDSVWTVSLISGVIYKGTGRPVGDFNIDTNTSQSSTKISGGGRLEKIF